MKIAEGDGELVESLMEESEPLTAAEKKHRQEIGARIKEARERAELTQPQLTIAVLGTDRAATTTDWEAGRKMPDAITLGKIADVLGVSADWLLGRPLEGSYRLTDADQEEIARLHAKIGRVLNRDPALRKIAASLDSAPAPD